MVEVLDCVGLVGCGVGLSSGGERESVASESRRLALLHFAEFLHDTIPT